MNEIQLKSGQLVFDPRGVVQAESKPISPRLTRWAGLRLGVLDNTKWNGGKLLRKTVALLAEEENFAEVRYYKKESFSKNAIPALIEQIAQENDAVLTAIAD